MISAQNNFVVFIFNCLYNIICFLIFICKNHYCYKIWFVICEFLFDVLDCIAESCVNYFVFYIIINKVLRNITNSEVQSSVILVLTVKWRDNKCNLFKSHFLNLFDYSPMCFINLSKFQYKLPRPLYFKNIANQRFIKVVK